MSFSIRMTDEERQLADSYAKLHNMLSVSTTLTKSPLKNCGRSSTYDISCGNYLAV